MYLCEEITKICKLKKVRLFYSLLEERERGSIDQFPYIKIQSKTINPSMRLWGINTEFVGFVGLLVCTRMFLVMY